MELSIENDRSGNAGSNRNAQHVPEPASRSCNRFSVNVHSDVVVDVYRVADPSFQFSRCGDVSPIQIAGKPGYTCIRVDKAGNSQANPIDLMLSFERLANFPHHIRDSVKNM